MDARQFDELKLTGNLPSPTGVGLAILQLTRDDNYSMGDVTRVIQSDPALTGRILKLSNTASFAAANPITTVAQAAMRVGARSVRNLALGFTLVSGNRSGRCDGFDYERYWSQSLAVAVMAQGLAEHCGGVSPADAFTCGLLSDIGSLALASIHSERYKQMLTRAAAEHTTDIVLLEREAFDLDHSELACAMLADWRLPDAFAFAVGALETRELPADGVPPATLALARVLRAARALALLTLDGDVAEPHVHKRLHQLLAAVGVEADEYVGLRRSWQANWAEWGRSLNIQVATRAEEPDPEPEAAAPATPAPAATPEATPAQLRIVDGTARHAQRRGLKILVVDDDPVSLRLLSLHLLRDGHEVVRATNGRQALIEALENTPQMVVTDWMMPEMDGIELCRTLRSTEECKGIYILMLTAREDEGRAVEALDAGADEYVTKPFDPQILRARVRAGQRTIELREQVERDRQVGDQQVAEMSVLNRKLETAAMTDVLTRLPNRRFAMRTLDDSVKNAVATGEPLSAIMIDLDRFKLINDTHGHGMGDLVLRETAAVLRASIRKDDWVCRYGGEEFIAICPGATLAQAAATAERMRAAVAEHVIGYGFGRAISISAGVAQLDPTAATVDDLIRVADERVYIAKESGRNRVVCESRPGPQAKSA
jgi:two-component system cell cycle response regulator